MTDFYCWTCPIQTSPPKCRIWKAISHLTKLTTMTIGLNVTEIPADAFLPINGQSKLETLTIIDQSNHGLVVKSGAFQNMNNLRQIKLPIQVKTFEKGAFKLNTKSDVELLIIFEYNFINGKTFDSGTFDGINRPVGILLYASTIDYFPEATFKPLLNDDRNAIQFISNDIQQSSIDCEDCRNLWLINDNKQNQVKNAICKSNPKKTLFDDDIASQLKAICK